MIAIFNRGSGFAGLIDYANDIENKNTNIIAAEGVATSGPRAMAATMHLQARSNPKVKQYVGHCILSFSPKDMARLTDGFVEQIARDFMQRMGIVNTQFAIYRHHDQPHDHVHIVYNRVDNNGEVMKHDTNFDMSVGIAAKMTREYGLTFGKGKKDVRRERLVGRDAAKYRFFDAISPLLAHVSSWEQFKAELAKMGYSMNMYYDKDGKARGVSFTDGQTSFGGAKIDRTLSYWAINNVIQRNASLEEAQLLQTAERNDSHSENKPSEVAESNNTQESVATQVATTLTTETEDVLGIIEDAASDFNSAASGVGAAIAEVVSAATEIQPSVGGGGGSSSLDDDDDEKNKNKYGYGRRGRKR